MRGWCSQRCSDPLTAYHRGRAPVRSTVQSARRHAEPTRVRLRRRWGRRCPRPSRGPRSPSPILMPTAAVATASTSLLESPSATVREQGNADVFADRADADCLRQVGGNDLEGHVACCSHGADNRTVSGRQCSGHPFQRGLLGRHVCCDLREGAAVDVDDEGRDRLGVFDPVLGVCCPPGGRKSRDTPRRGPSGRDPARCRRRRAPPTGQSTTSTCSRGMRSSTSTRFPTQAYPPAPPTSPSKPTSQKRG